MSPDILILWSGQKEWTMAGQNWKSSGTLVAGAVAMTLIIALIVWWGYHASQALSP
jgi:hypothetical protein